MSKSGSRYGRRSNWFKIHCLLSSQGQNGGMNSLPETNNNNSTVTNNNNNGNSNSSAVNHHQHTIKHHVPSTVTSHGLSGGGHAHGHIVDSDPDRERMSHHHRQRSSSSGNSHLLPSNPLTPNFLPNLSAMSPDTKEQFLSSMNRKMMTPDLLEYFRSANLSLPPNGLGGLGMSKPFFPDERIEDMSRTSRSPGSMESPNSDASGDDTKPPNHIPLFGLPPGSPLDVKPNDILSFDLLTRDLMKLGYDPVRFWPAMLSAPPSSLHQFNPYRFMFPNFPGGGAGGAMPPGFPPSPMIGNGFLGAPLLPNNGNPLLTGSNKLLVGPSSTDSSAPPPHQNRRFPLIVPPASSLTLTPPISHHGSDEPNNLSTSKKVRKFSSQDQPIDLSAKALITNNNNEIESFVKVKGEPSDPSESDISDFDDEEEEEEEDGRRVHRSGGSCSDSSGSSSHCASASLPIKPKFHKSSSSLRDSGQDEDHCDGDDESESTSHPIHRKERKRLDRHPSSTGSNSSGPPLKKHKVSTPLDLTRATSSNPPPTKVAT